MDSAILEAVSKRNPGAMSVCFQLEEAFGELSAFDFSELWQQGIGGSDLWDLYKTCCHADIDELHAAIMQRTGAEKLRAVPGSTFWHPAFIPFTPGVMSEDGVPEED